MWNKCICLLIRLTEESAGRRNISAPCSCVSLRQGVVFEKWFMSKLYSLLMLPCGYEAFLFCTLVRLAFVDDVFCLCQVWTFASVCFFLWFHSDGLLSLMLVSSLLPRLLPACVFPPLIAWCVFIVWVSPCPFLCPPAMLCPLVRVSHV